jgi:hypothetical protein
MTPIQIRKLMNFAAIHGQKRMYLLAFAALCVLNKKPITSGDMSKTFNKIMKEKAILAPNSHRSLRDFEALGYLTLGSPIPIINNRKMDTWEVTKKGAKEMKGIFGDIF